MLQANRASSWLALIVMMWGVGASPFQDVTGSYREPDEGNEQNVNLVQSSLARDPRKHHWNRDSNNALQKNATLPANPQGRILLPDSSKVWEELILNAEIPSTTNRADDVFAFKREHYLKPSATIAHFDLRRLEKDVLFWRNFQETPFDETFTSDALVMADGLKMSTADLNRRESPQMRHAVTGYVGDWQIYIEKNPKTNQIELISSENGEKSLDFIRDRSGTFARVDMNDVDYVKMNSIFRYGDTHEQNTVAGGGPRRRRNLQDTSATRSLQSCGAKKLRKIKTAIAFDSSLCKLFGNQKDTITKIKDIISSVNKLYRRNGVCIKNEIVYMEGHCDPNKDPYRPLLLKNRSGCDGRSGMLYDVSMFWRQARYNVQRDVVQIYTGTALESGSSGNVIGCALTGSLCDSVRGYGLNWLSFTRNIRQQTILAAHEIGHTAGARHDDKDGFVMSGTLNRAPNGFSKPSSRHISNFVVKKATCLRTKKENQDANQSDKPTNCKKRLGCDKQKHRKEENRQSQENNKNEPTTCKKKLGCDKDENGEIILRATAADRRKRENHNATDKKKRSRHEKGNRKETNKTMIRRNGTYQKKKNRRNQRNRSFRI